MSKTARTGQVTAMSKCLQLVVAVSASLLAVISAQEGHPVFRVGSDLVVIDLVATDRTGRLVNDLRPSEIRILEDGRPQALQFLRLVHGGANSREGDARGAEVPVPSRTSEPSPERVENAPIDTRVGIVIDLGSISVDALPRVRDHIAQTLREGMPERVPAMVATLGPQVHVRQPFTTDRNALIAAVDALRATPGTHATFAEVLNKVDQLCDAARPRTLGDWAIASGREIIAEANQRVVETSIAISMLAQSLAAVGGRKHLVFYSAAYPIDPVSQVTDAVTAGVAACTGTDMVSVRRRAAAEFRHLSSRAATDGLRMAVDRANRAQVSFYVVDVRGLMTTAVQAEYRGRSRTGGTGALVRLPALNEKVTQDYLNVLATDTGGRSFFDTNDIGIALRRAWQDGVSYYLIGYQPAAGRKKGQFHKVELKVSRPDLDLRYRRAYYDATERELAEADIDNALRVPGAFDREGFDVWTAVDGKTLRIEVRVPTAAIRLTPAGDVHHAEFSVHGELRDRHGALVGGKPIPGRDVALRLDPERLKAIRASEKLAVRLETPMPKPGTYTLGVVARDSGGWMAVRTIEVHSGQ